MARPTDLLLKNLGPPPHDVIPRAAWLEILAEHGDLVIASPVNVRSPCGALMIGYRFNQETMAKVKAILISYSDEPWRTDFSSQPWSSDPDAWKNG